MHLYGMIKLYDVLNEKTNYFGILRVVFVDVDFVIWL